MYRFKLDNRYQKRSKLDNHYHHFVSVATSLAVVIVVSLPVGLVPGTGTYDTGCCEFEV